MRNVGPPHSGGSAPFITLSLQLSELPESCQQRELTFLLTVAFRATKNLEPTVLPVNYRRWQHRLSELPILSTVGVDISVDHSFHSYQIPTTLRADVLVAIRATKNLEGTMLPVNYRSWQHSFLKLPILSTVGIDIPVDYSFKSYKSCQQLGLTFLSTIAFTVTKSRQL